jgi:hypothetical protein
VIRVIPPHLKRPAAANAAPLSSFCSFVSLNMLSY